MVKIYQFILIRIGEKCLWAGLTAGLAVFFSACPYQPVKQPARLSAPMESLALPLAVNRTIEAGLEDVFTQELIRRFRADGRVMILPPGQAKTELRCTLTDLSVRPVSYTREGRVAAEAVEIELDCRLIMPGTEGTLWQSGSLSAREEYPVGDDYLLNEETKARAVAETAKDLAESVRSLLLDSF